MKALVTGATGFIGSHLTEHLVHEGYCVKALARPSSDLELLENLGVEIVTADLRDADAVERAAAGCERIFHLASARPRNTPTRGEYFDTNIEGAANVGRAALKVGASRLIFTSSVGVYGLMRHWPVDETSPTHPNSLYQSSQLASEKELLALHAREDLPVVIARLSSIIGPRSKSWLAFYRAAGRKNFRTIGSGRNHVQMCYVSDVVHGLIRCSETPGVEGETFIITGDDALTVEEFISVVRGAMRAEGSPGRIPATPYRVFTSLASLIYRSLGIEVPHANRYDLFLGDMAFDISKARDRLNYHPQVPLGDGVARMAAWYRDHGLL